MPTRGGARSGGGHPPGYQFAWVERVERVSGTCHQDLSTLPRATAPGARSRAWPAPRLRCQTAPRRTRRPWIRRVTS